MRLMNVIVGRLDRGARATGAARGQQIALFTGTALRNLCVIHRNWNLELFLSNVFVQFLISCSKINAKSGNIHLFTDFISLP